MRERIPFDAKQKSGTAPDGSIPIDIYGITGGGGGGAVDSVNGKTGAVVLTAANVGAATAAQGTKADTAVQPAGLTKAAVGLGNVDNTSDANKPVSTAQAAAIAAVAASVTALDIETVARSVMVVTGTEARPAGDYCIWNDLREGEVSEPANMLATDSWFRPRVGPTPVAPTITTTALGAMTQSSSTSQQLAATGTTPITWAVTTGTLPAGLALSTAGVLSGTPTASGAYSFTVTATNSAGSDPQAYTGTIAAPGGASEHTIFAGPGAPHVLTRNTDGAPNIELATGFYGTDVAGNTITKVGVYVPTGVAPSSIAVRLYHPAVNGAPTLGSGAVASGVVSAPVAGQWNWATLDTPLVMQNNRIVWASYDAGAGVYFASTGAMPGGGSIEAHDGSFLLSDAQPYATGSGRRNHFRIGTGSTSANTDTWYGLDVVMQEA